MYWSYINNIISPNEDETVQESNNRFCGFIKHKKQDTQEVAWLKSIKWETGKWQQKESHHTKQPIQISFLTTLPTIHETAQQIKQAMNDASPKVPKINPFEIMEECIRKRLPGLNPNKATGPNKLQPWVKELAYVSYANVWNTLWPAR